MVFLFDVQYKSFEVFPFGVVDVHGVVGGLCELMEYAHAAPALRRRAEYGKTELFAAHSLRT